MIKHLLYFTSRLLHFQAANGRCLVLFSLILFSFAELAAQNGLNYAAGARGLAMANASTAFQDINSIFSNAAGLASLEKSGISLFAEQRFAVSEIKSVHAGFAHPTKSGTFGVRVQYYGFEDYNEQSIGLSYARKLLDKLSLGAQINYLNFRIPEYGNRGLVTFDIGLQSQILEDLRIGFHLANPIEQEIVVDDNLPTVFKVGIAYNPSKKVMLTLEGEKDIDFETRVKGGIEYWLVDALALRLGFASNPGTFSFGAGYDISEKLKIDFGASYHQILGFSPGIGILFYP